LPAFLLVSPYFPPMGVVGAKRPLFLARNLPRFGWDAVVLAADPARENPDPSLGELVPESLAVSRGYGSRLRGLFGRKKRAKPKPREKRVRVLGREMPILWPFDPYLVDAPAAIREARRLVERHSARAIAVCADPFSAFFVGMSVAARTDLPLVLDLRDPWSLHPGRAAMRPAPTRAVVRAVERRAFERAAKVVLNTEDCLAAYRDAYRGIVPEERFTFIRNAFDPSVFADGAAPPRDASFVVLHFGFFRRFVPSLPLLEGFERFVRAEKLSPADARLRCVGGLRPEDEADARRLGIAEFVEAVAPVPYRRTQSTLAAADVLAVVVDPRSRLCVPAKIYDYLAAERPILAISDVDEVGRILAETGAGRSFPRGDTAAVAAALADMRAKKLRGELRGPDAAAVRSFGAEAQARRFAAVLDEVTSR